MRLTDTQSRIIFGSSVILSTILQIWRLDKWSFWFDESYTSALISTSPSRIIELTSVDVHPPFYYLFLHFWSRLFGTSDFALRSLSMLLILASVLFLVLLLKKLVEKRYAYVAASFAALAPFTIRYGQEARMYAMVSAILLAATYLFVVQMQRKRRQRDVKTWVLYAVLMTLAFYTHYFSVLILVAHIAYALFHDTRTKDGKTWLVRLKNRLSLMDRRFIKSLVLIPIFFAPWAPTLLDQFNAVNEGFWIPDVSMITTVSVFTTLTIFQEVFAYGPLLYITSLLILGTIIAMYHLVKRAEDDELRALWFVFAGFLFPLLLLAAISLPSFTSSYFYFRYFAQFSMFYYAGLILVAMFGIKYLGRWIGWGMFTLLVALSLAGTVRVLEGTDKSGNTMNEAFPVLSNEFMEGDEIVATGYDEWFNGTHYNDTSTSVKYHDQGFGWGSLAPIYEADEDLVVSADYSDVDPASGRVWLIRERDSESDVPDNWQQIRDVIDARESYIVLYEVR